MGLKTVAAGIAALGAAVAMLPDGSAAAKPGGFGFKGKPAHIAKWHSAHFPRTFRRAQFLGFAAGYWPGFYPGLDVGPIVAQPTVQRLDPYIEPAPSLSCKRSREIVTVRSEDGGERKISITRC